MYQATKTHYLYTLCRYMRKIQGNGEVNVLYIMNDNIFNIILFNIYLIFFDHAIYAWWRSGVDAWFELGKGGGGGELYKQIEVTKRGH